MTEQLLVRLPVELVQRLRRHVPARQRSAFVRKAIELALPHADAASDPLYQAALAVEADDKLAAEMAEWDVTVGDGLIGPPALASR